MTVSTDVDDLHHVGLVVHDMERALDAHRRLGFVPDIPAYPLLPTVEGTAAPFGAVNTHVTFDRTFLEVATIVDDDTAIPADAELVPLDVPTEDLPQVTAVVQQAVDTLSDRLERFEGLHRLVFATADADAVAARLRHAGVFHSGVTTTQRPIDTDAGVEHEIVRHLELADLSSHADAVPEAMVAIAEAGAFDGHRPPAHPNGAVGLVDVVVSAGPDHIATVERRYRTYLDREAVAAGPARRFELEHGSLTLVADHDLDAMLPGEHAPDGPALVGYAVEVTDLAHTGRLLSDNGVEAAQLPSGDLLVPSRLAVGAAVVFRQAA